MVIDLGAAGGMRPSYVQPEPGCCCWVVRSVAARTVEAGRLHDTQGSNVCQKTATAAGRTCHHGLCTHSWRIDYFKLGVFPRPMPNGKRCTARSLLALGALGREYATERQSAGTKGRANLARCRLSSWEIPHNRRIRSPGTDFAPPKTCPRASKNGYEISSMKGGER